MLKTYAGAANGEIDDFETVVADPASFYPDPAAIADDAGLTRGQKLRLLGEWAQDLIDRQVAENEGMGPESIGAIADGASADASGALGSGGNETALLHQVNNAIETVEASPDAAPGLLTRVWRRLIAD